MKFYVLRTSDRFKDNSEEAIIGGKKRIVDMWNDSDEYDVDYLAECGIKFYEQDFSDNSRYDLNKIVYEIHFNSLDELINFMKMYQKIIIYENWYRIDGKMCKIKTIEIYDDYRG